MNPKLPKACKFCDKVGHWPYQCFKNPHKPRYNLNKKSKHLSRWKKTRRQWFTDNPADYYTCYICYKSLLPAETTLDHKLSRSRRPDLRYDLTNLAPACFECNSEKGSLSIDQLNKLKNM